MKKHNLIPIMVLILTILSTGVLSEPNPDVVYMNQTLISYWSYDINAQDDKSTHDGSPFGDATHIMTGLLDGAYQFSGGGRITVPDATVLDMTQENFSISVWFNQTLDDIGGLFGKRTSNLGYQIRVESEDRVKLFSDGTATITGSYSLGQWNHVVVTKNRTNIIMYLNGNLAVQEANHSITANTFDLGFGTWEIVANTYVNNFTGQLDEIGFFDQTLTPNMVSELYNNGEACNPVLSDVCIPLSPINFIGALSPSNDTRFNYNPNINITVNSTQDYICNLTINSQLNYSVGYSIPPNISLFNVTNSYDDGFYDINVTCYNENASITSSTNTFSIDTINPAIGVISFVNESLYLNGNLTGRFNFSDDVQLASYNITVDQNTVLAQASGLTTTYEQVNISELASKYGLGTHKLNVKVADGHTAKAIPEYQVRQGWVDKYIEYEHPKGDIVRIIPQDQSIFDSWDTRKEKDRYNFTYEPNNPRSAYTFNVETNTPLHIIEREDNLYGGSWIITSNQWLDFYQPSAPNNAVTINQTSLTTATVTVTPPNPSANKLEFKSIGDLNIVEQNYTFYVANATLTYTTPVVYNQRNNIVFSINYTSPTLNTTITISYNNTNKGVTQSSTSTQTAYATTAYSPNVTGVNNVTIPINVTYNLTTPTSSEQATIGVNQLVLNQNVGLCTLGSTQYPLLNMNYYNEQSSTPLNLTNAYQINVTDGRTQFNGVGSLDTGNFTDQLCSWLNPSVLSYNLWNMSGTFTLSDPGFVTRIVTYNTLNPISLNNNPIANLSLFLIPTENSSTVTYTWLTTQFQPITGTMEVYRCNGDGSQSLVESSPIVNGQAVANIELLTQPYSYEVIIDGQTYTDPSFTTCHIETQTERTYFVEVISSNIEELVGLMTLTCKLSNLGSNVVQMNWSTNVENPTDIEGCLIAYRDTLQQKTVVYENCTTAPSASVERTIPNNTFSYYITGRLTQGDNVLYCSDVVAYPASTPGNESLGVTGLYIAVLIILSMALFFAPDGENAVMASAVAIAGTWFVGLYIFPWVVVTGILTLLVGAIIIGRYTQK